jgi:hypothetical protein
MMMLKIQKILIVGLAYFNLFNATNAMEHHPVDVDKMNAIHIPKVEELPNKKPYSALVFTEEELQKLGGLNSETYRQITQAALTRVGQEDYYEILEVFSKKVKNLETECRYGEYYWSRCPYTISWYMIRSYGVPQSNKSEDLKQFPWRGTFKKYSEAICCAGIYVTKQYLSSLQGIEHMK